MCVDGGVKNFAKLLASAGPSGHSRVSWQSPSGALGPGMAAPVEDDKKKKKILFFMKELFPFICTGVFIN